jgi:hypothetical protein
VGERRGEKGGTRGWERKRDRRARSNGEMVRRKKVEERRKEEEEGEEGTKKE